MNARDAVRDTLAPLVGRRVPGGCEHCDAYQTVALDDPGPGLFMITVHHDEWCPLWVGLRAGDQQWR